MNKDILLFLKELKQSGLKRNIPNISEKVGFFLFNLILDGKLKNGLEVGSANGYSAIFIGLGMKENFGKLKTFEISKVNGEEFMKNIKTAGIEDSVIFFNIDFLLYEIDENEVFDFVFIDGVKKLYKDFFLKIKKNTNKDSIIVFDNIKKFGFKMKSFFKQIKDELEEENIWNFIEIEFDDLRKDSLCLFFSKENSFILEFLNKNNIKFQNFDFSKLDLNIPLEIRMV